MHFLDLFKLPLQNHVLIFALLLLIIFLVPYIFEKVKLPSLVGLLIVGTLVGEKGFNVLTRNASIVLFGTVGVLYIMFLAGLEIDLHDFKKFKFKSLAFGVLTFSLPMLIGTYANYHLLGMSMISSILLASMYASHTLLAYPLASKFKITKNEAITVAVGGTMITDIAALFVLAIIANATTGELNFEFWQRMIISSALFFIFTLVILPKVAHWFFKRFESGGHEQFIFVLALVFIGGATAEMAGIEPIIGAFLVGLALNSLIPTSSILMNRLEFVGNSLFIPFFLISVGMLVDIRVFYRDVTTIKVALVMTTVAMLTKYLAAYFTSKIFKYTKIQRNLIFSLSNAQAAATLAAVLVGHRLQLLDDSVLNGTIMMILVTCLVSSLVMQKSGKEQARIEAETLPEKKMKEERIFVGINRPQSLTGLLDLAIYFKKEHKDTAISLGTVVEDDEGVEFSLKNARELLTKATEHIVGSGVPAETFTRIDLNTESGLNRMIQEAGASLVIKGWHGPNSTADRIFGSKLDHFLGICSKLVVISNIVYNVNTTKRVVVIMPRFASDDNVRKQHPPLVA